MDKKSLRELIEETKNAADPSANFYKNRKVDDRGDYLEEMAKKWGKAEITKPLVTATPRNIGYETMSKIKEESESTWQRIIRETGEELERERARQVKMKEDETIKILTSDHIILATTQLKENEKRNAGERIDWSTINYYSGNSTVKIALKLFLEQISSSDAFDRKRYPGFDTFLFFVQSLVTYTSHVGQERMVKMETEHALSFAKECMTKGPESPRLSPILDSFFHARRRRFQAEDDFYEKESAIFFLSNEIGEKLHGIESQLAGIPFPEWKKEGLEPWRLLLFRNLHAILPELRAHLLQSVALSPVERAVITALRDALKEGLGLLSFPSFREKLLVWKRTEKLLDNFLDQATGLVGNKEPRIDDAGIVWPEEAKSYSLEKEKASTDRTLDSIHYALGKEEKTESAPLTPYGEDVKASKYICNTFEGEVFVVRLMEHVRKVIDQKVNPR